MAADDAGTVKKLRDDQKEARGRACVIVQASATAPPPTSTPRLTTRSRCSTTSSTRRCTPRATSRSTWARSRGRRRDDLLLMLAMQAARLGRLDQAWHCANRCGTRPAVRIRSSYVREMVRVAQLDRPRQRAAAGRGHPADGRHADRRAQAARGHVGVGAADGDAELVQEGCVLIWNICPAAAAVARRLRVRALTLACASLGAWSRCTRCACLPRARSRRGGGLMARAKERPTRAPARCPRRVRRAPARPPAPRDAAGARAQARRAATPRRPRKAINLDDPSREAASTRPGSTQLCALLTASDDAAGAPPPTPPTRRRATPPRAPARRRRPTPRRWRARERAALWAG